MLVCIDPHTGLQNVLEIALPAVPALVRSRAVEHRLVGRSLQIEIERRVHAQSRAMGLLDAILVLELPPHLLDVGRLAVRGRLQIQPERRSLCLRCLLGSDLVVAQHLLKNQIPALERAVRIAHRRVVLRALGQRCQQCRFGQRQVPRMLAEVVLGAGLKAVCPAPHIDLVGIQRKDLRLGEAPFDLQRQEDLLQLATVSLLRGEKEVSRQLHRQRRRALRLAMAMHIPVSRAHHTHQVDTAVVLEVLVLDRENRLAQHRRKLRIRNHDAPLQREGAEDLSVDVVEFGRRAGAVALQIRHLWQVDRVDKDQPQHHAEESRCGQQQQNRRAGCKLAIAGLGILKRKAAHGAPQHRPRV